MYTKLKNKRVIEVGSNIVDLANIEKSDLEFILKKNGMVPLSIEEREYLETLHSRLKYTTNILIELRDMLHGRDMANIELNDVISDNCGILQVSIDDIGCGHKITKEGINDD